MKRRKLAHNRVEELTFDPTARQEYLTGFHKRKQARIQNARDAAIKREKEERIKERQQMRERRKEELEQHVQAVNAETRKQRRMLQGYEDDDSSDYSVESNRGENAIQEETVERVESMNGLEKEAEYVDEEKYTTVTVEEMGEEDGGSDGEETTSKQRGGVETAKVTRKTGTKRKALSGTSSKSKSKARSFRYESKAERTAGRQKQKLKNRAAKARREGK